jgi:hypothetical protein
MSEIAKLIDGMVKQGLAPVLRRDGYRKFGHTFARELPETTQIVNVQSDRWNAGSEGRFTLNVGVYFPAVAVLQGGVAPSGYPKEYDATIRTRIGALLPAGIDRWWSLSSEGDVAPVAEEMTHVYEEWARPWLAKMTNLREVAKEPLRPLTAISIALALNDRERATSVLAEAVPTLNQHSEPTFRAFAARHGLPWPETPAFKDDG